MDMIHTQHASVHPVPCAALLRFSKPESWKRERESERERVNCHCCVFVCVYKLDACMHAAFCLAPSSSSSSCAPLCITPLANSLRTLFLMQLWQCNYLARRRRQRQQQKRRNYTVPSPRVLFLLSRLSLFLFLFTPLRTVLYCTVQNLSPYSSPFKGRMFQGVATTLFRMLCTAVSKCNSFNINNE